MELEPDFAAASALLDLLDQPERARADRFHFAEDRDSYIAAHALLRAMLAETGGLAASAWRFEVAEGGKPEIDRSLGRPDLRFSLSHARGMAACAIGHIDDLGVDVEDCRRPVPILELAQRFFAPAEAALIAGEPAARRNAAFFRLWTLKEAYLKATGRGILAPLDAFAFSLDPVAISFLGAEPDEPGAWQFAEVEPAASHRLALAVRHPRADPLRFDLAAATPGWCLGNRNDVDRRPEQ
ncbi:MAG TPA: 4'-phosphopantetheinyl transferase superfamily protein [Aliidongia sp.]|nr:4'-phosphopantetheinyl transferase superfamily protein [Aliidongia sp.]